LSDIQSSGFDIAAKKLIVLMAVYVFYIIRKTGECRAMKNNRSCVRYLNKIDSRENAIRILTEISALTLDAVPGELVHDGVGFAGVNSQDTTGYEDKIRKEGRKEGRKEESCLFLFICTSIVLKK